MTDLEAARRRFINADPLDVKEYDAAWKALQEAKKLAKGAKS